MVISKVALARNRYHRKASSMLSRCLLFLFTSWNGGFTSERRPSQCLWPFLKLWCPIMTVRLIYVQMITCFLDRSFILLYHLWDLCMDNNFHLSGIFSLVMTMTMVTMMDWMTMMMTTTDQIIIMMRKRLTMTRMSCKQHLHTQLDL